MRARIERRSVWWFRRGPRQEKSARPTFIGGGLGVAGLISEGLHAACAQRIYPRDAGRHALELLGVGCGRLKIVRCSRSGMCISGALVAGHGCSGWQGGLSLRSAA